MNKLSLTKLFLFLFVLSLATGSGNAQIFHKNPEKQLFGKAHRNNKEVKAKEPRSVLKAKRKQEANDRRLEKNYEKSVRKSGKAHRNNKEVKVKEPRSVLKAKRKQEANDRRLEKNYEKSVRKSQKRTIDIQTPEVQARMKQNKKDTIVRGKEKKKKVKANSQKAGKKYK